MSRHLSRLAYLRKRASEPAVTRGFFAVIDEQTGQWTSFSATSETPVEVTAEAMLAAGFDPDTVANLAGASAAKSAASAVLKAIDPIPMKENPKREAQPTASEVEEPVGTGTGDQTTEEPNDGNSRQPSGGQPHHSTRQPREEGTGRFRLPRWRHGGNVHPVVHENLK